MYTRHSRVRVSPSRVHINGRRVTRAQRPGRSRTCAERGAGEELRARARAPLVPRERVELPQHLATAQLQRPQARAAAHEHAPLRVHLRARRQGAEARRGARAQKCSQGLGAAWAFCDAAGLRVFVLRRLSCARGGAWPRSPGLHGGRALRPDIAAVALPQRLGGRRRGAGARGMTLPRSPCPNTAGY